MEHVDGRVNRIPLLPNRSVAEVTQDLLKAVAELVGDIQINLKPQETPWQTPLDEDTEHATYDPPAVETLLHRGNPSGARVVEFRAPYRGRSTPVNAWWGSFDLAVSLFSGRRQSRLPKIF